MSKEVDMRANRYGLKVFPSSRRDKKYYIIHPKTNRKIHFGAKYYSDFTKHKDPMRRMRYRDRHRNIMMNINGMRRPAYKIKYTPAWLSWNLLW